MSGAFHTYAAKTAARLAAAFAVAAFAAGAAGAVSADESFALGRKMFDRGFYQAAYRDFDDYLKQNPGGEWADEAQFYLGRSLHELASYQEAIAEYRRLITNYPTSPLVAAALTHKGECYAALENYDLAIKTYRRALAAAPDAGTKVRAYQKLGETYFQAGEADKAAETYEESLRKFPEAETAGTLHFRLALLYFLKGDFESSTLQFEAARNSAAVDAAAVDAAYGQSLLAAGEPKAAAEVLERSLGEADADVPRNLSRAVSCVAAGAPETGAAVLGEILAAEPRGAGEPAAEAEVRYVLALAWVEAGDRHRASETFRALAELYPQSPYAAPAGLCLGRLALEDGDVDGAAGSFAALAGSGDPLAEEAKYWLGWCYFVSRRYDESRRAFDDFAARAPDETRASFGRYWAAEAATRAANNAESREQIRAFAARHPEHPLADNALFRLGKLLLAAGRPEAARETLASLAERYADRELADDALYLYALSLLEQKMEAAPAFGELVAKFPASPYASKGLFDLAQARFGAHDFDGAVETLAALLARYPDAGVAEDASFMMGECFLHQRQYERAKETYAALVEKYPASRRADEARYEIELCNFKQGKYRSQIELAKSYIAMYPQSRLNGELLILLGEYYYHARDYDQAEKYLAAVAEVKADERTVFDARTLLAEVYLARGETAKAVTQYQAVAAAAPAEAALAALLKVADIYERAGDRSAAIETCGVIVERFGESRETARAQFKIGENMRAARLYRESNTALEKLARKWPATEYTPQAELYWGLNLLELGEPDEAVDHLAAAAGAGSRPLAAQAYYFLGVAERDRGNDAHSRECFTKVLTNYRDFPDWVRKAQGELKRR